jgi:elongation factor 2 kinase
MSSFEVSNDQDLQVTTEPLHLSALGSRLMKITNYYKAQQDPWEKYSIHKLPLERVRRHLYLPNTKTWVVVESLVKIEREPFTHGAMRQAFRMKKLFQLGIDNQESKGHHISWYRINWHKAPNFVAKCSIDDLDKDGNLTTKDRMSYFNNVILQHEAAKWAQEFNKLDPPKKILIIDSYVIEFFERPGYSNILIVTSFYESSGG